MERQNGNQHKHGQVTSNVLGWLQHGTLPRKVQSMACNAKLRISTQAYTWMLRQLVGYYITAPVNTTVAQPTQWLDPSYCTRLTVHAPDLDLQTNSVKRPLELHS